MTTSDQVLRHFGRHVIALSVHVYEGGCPRHLLVNGTVLDLDGEWYFLTAGHCLSEIGDVLAQPGCVFDRAKLHDSFGINPINVDPVPFEYDPGSTLTVEDDTLGIDFGLVHLRRYYRATLEKNGIVGIREVDNTEPLDENPSENFAVFGLPVDLRRQVSESLGGNLIAHTVVSAFWLPLIRSSNNRRAQGRFEGTIRGECPVGIEGMSGGPIIHISEDGSSYPYGQNTHPASR